MKSKQYFIKQLCELRNLDVDGEEAQEMESMKVVDLLIAIKDATPGKSSIKSEDGEDESFSNRAGCRF